MTFDSVLSEKKKGEEGVEKISLQIDENPDLKQELRREPWDKGWSFNPNPVQPVKLKPRLDPISDNSIEILSEKSNPDLLSLEKMVLDLSSRLDKQTRLTESLELTVKSLQLKVETLSSQTANPTPDPEPTGDSPGGQTSFLTNRVGPKPKHYNSKSYLDLERGKFQRGTNLKDAISKALDELINKHPDDKEQMEQRLDELYLHYLPQKFIEF